MGKFEFRSRTIDLDIAGNMFKLDVDSRIGDKMKSYSADAYKLAEEIEKKKKKTEDALKYCGIVLDELLGTGATDKIFATREMRLEDCLDILYYITDEVNGYHAKNSANRSQRRAASKKKS